MSDLSELVSNALIRVARTADEIRNGMLLAKADGDVRLEPIPMRGARPKL